jgi:hypothetical protein
MATSVPSSGDQAPLRFAISGPIKMWDPAERWLWLDERPLWVPPEISVPIPVAGTSVTVVGHREKPNGRWVVTYITHHSPLFPGLTSQGSSLHRGPGPCEEGLPDA